MEALKKAEQAKQGATAPEETSLSLEAVEPTKEKADPSFPELDLGAGTGGLSAVPGGHSPSDAAAPPLETDALLAIDAAPPPPVPEAATGLAGMGGLPPNSQKKEAEPTPKMELTLEPTPLLAKEPEPASPPAPKVAEPAATPQPRPAEPQPRPAPPLKRPEAAKQQARNVFSAKTGSTKPSLSLSKPIWAAIGVGTALLMAGTGYYFYREMNPPLLALQPGQPAPVPTAPPAPAPAVPAPVVAEAPPAAPESQPAPLPTEPSPRTATNMAEAPPERGDIRIQRGTPTETLNPNLTRAYQALQADNLSEAQDAYGKVLKTDRNNRDALLGLAALQERKGDAESAARLYQRLLELDPNDGAAQAALTGLGQGDPVRSESRLKSLLAQQPDSDTLHFALANLYAGQQRWAEAQQSYFRAFQKQPGNPDYLYNLAVSLDHLGQNKLARDYYRKALAAANRPHNFSPEEVGARIGALEQAAP